MGLHLLRRSYFLPLTKKRTEIDVFLELFYFFHDPADVGNLISGSSAFSKTISKVILEI